MSRLSGEEHLPSKPMLLFHHLVIRIKFNLAPRVLSYLSPLTLWDKWKNTLGARLEYVFECKYAHPVQTSQRKISRQAFSQTLKTGRPEGMFCHKIIRD